MGKEEEILAAVMAATSKPDYATCDKIEALTKGHGMLTISVMVTANAVMEELLRGASVKLTDADIGSMQLDDIIEKEIKAAENAGASPENAALIAASFAYFAGSSARVGMPSANRKLGDMARIHAGVGRTSVINLPTFKSTHRLTAFPAIKAIYDLIEKGSLTKIDGRYLPMAVAGGSIYGHSSLGEDISYPEIAKNGATAATKAMIEAYYNIGISPSQLMAALIGATATMEILHPDGFVGEEFGLFGTVSTSDLAGKSAADAAGLPEKLHMKGTEEEYDTGKLIGDFATILRGVGPSSVIGMFALAELFASFKEGAFIGAGFSGGPVNPPTAHIMADSLIMMKLLQKYDGDKYKAADILQKVKEESFIDPNMALCALNMISRKAEEVRRGPITEALIIASEGVRDREVYNKAVKTYEGLKKNKTLEEICKDLDDERKSYVEERASDMFSKMFGKDIKLKFVKLAPQARRTDGFTKQFWGFDAYIDADVTIDGKTIKFRDFSNKAIPDIVLNKKENLKDPAAIVAIASQELMYIGHTIFNITVPAAVAASMGIMPPEEAAKKATNGAYLTNAIPGGKARAILVANISKRIASSFK